MTSSSARDDSPEALEALLRIKMGPCSTGGQGLSHSFQPPTMISFPVPNPLDPTQPHIIESEVVTAPSPVITSSGVLPQSPVSTQAASTPVVPNPLLRAIMEEKDESKFSTPASAAKTFLRRARAAATCRPASLSLSGSDSSLAIAREKPSPPAHGFRLDFHVSSLSEKCTNKNTSNYPATTKQGDLNLNSFAGTQAELLPPPSPSAFDANSHVRTEKIRDALQSKPQRGKKRRNLNALERLELTRTRNREHAKSTRMKKKARHQELLDIEQRYREIKRREALSHRRRERLVNFVNNQVKSQIDDPLYGRLKQQAADEFQIQDANFYVRGENAHTAIALANGDSGFIKVEARGPRSLSMQGVISVEFENSDSANITTVSLHLTLPLGKITTPPSGSIIPSIASQISLEMSHSIYSPQKAEQYAAECLGNVRSSITTKQNLTSSVSFSVEGGGAGGGNDSAASF